MMRPLWKDILIALWLGMLLPGIAVNAAVFFLRQQPEEELVIPVEAAQHRQDPMLLMTETGASVTMELEDYLTGAVLAEMPAAFHEEALKSQAVAARTYACKAAATGGKHGNGSVCTAPVCCQAYISEEDYLSQGGTEQNLEKVRAAVAATSGQVLYYGGELIEATYFSSSGGSTEAAVAVWGTDFPYLQAVNSPGEEASAHHRRSVSYTPLAFQKVLGAMLPGTPDAWFGEVVYTAGGGVETMEIGGQAYTGQQLRSLLALDSTAFTIFVAEDIITITTRGYGHRVGMSQYGANAMAEAGHTYDRILLHYYPGTELLSIN